MMKFLITNAHSSNSGDLAIQATLIRQLHKISGDAEITVLCSYPEFSRKNIGGDTSFKNYIWPIFDGTPSFQEFVQSAFMLLDIFLSALVYRVSGKRIFSEKNSPFGDFLDSDIVIGAGGGYLSHDYGFIRPYADYLLAKFLGKKLILYNHSIGPFGGSINRAVSGFVLRKADLIIVREKRSKKNLEELGIKNARLSADLAFAFTGFKPANKRKNTVVICPRKSIYRCRNKEDNYFMLLASLSKKLISSGKKVIILPTTPEDIKLYESLKKVIPEEVEYINTVHPPDKIAELLSESEFLVSSRIHPIILGSLSSTPFFALGWEYKLDEISKMICEDCHANAYDANDKTTDLILQNIKRRKKIGSRNLLLLRKQAESSAEIMNESLVRWGYI